MSDVTDVVNPTTEAVITQVPIHGVEATDEAVARSVAAGPAWRAMAPADRARLMRRFAAMVEEHHEELSQLETANVGKPIVESRGEVGMVAEVLYFYAGAIDKHRGATVPVAGGVDMTFNEPLGVVGAIIPWNFPAAITSWKVGPALATGNTIVVKPAEITPLTAVRMAELGLEAGLPEGVLQVVTGKGSVVGTRLAEHPDVAKVAFTGSTEVGRDVMTRASGTIKRVTLELGGKSASVVFADADLSKAAASAPGGMFANAGQDCCARSRILVQRSALDEFLDLLTDAVLAWTVGDPTDPATECGPIVNKVQYDEILAAIEQGTAQGGTVIAGGEPLGGDNYVIRPTVFEGVADDAFLSCEEVFGPVTSLYRFSTLDEAIERANAVPFGLSASIFTSSLVAAHRFSTEVEAGILHVNSQTAGAEVHVPFGGIKSSGFGPHEQGRAAIEFYTETVTVYQDL